jgi:hypothetical protein
LRIKRANRRRVWKRAFLFLFSFSFSSFLFPMGEITCSSDM